MMPSQEQTVFSSALHSVMIEFINSPLHFCKKRPQHIVMLVDIKQSYDTRSVGFFTGRVKVPGRPGTQV